MHYGRDGRARWPTSFTLFCQPHRHGVHPTLGLRALAHPERWVEASGDAHTAFRRWLPAGPAAGYGSGPLGVVRAVLDGRLRDGPEDWARAADEGRPCGEGGVSLFAPLAPEADWRCCVRQQAPIPGAKDATWLRTPLTASVAPSAYSVVSDDTAAPQAAVEREAEADGGDGAPKPGTKRRRQGDDAARVA
jgi:hypothetical protein